MSIRRIVNAATPNAVSTCEGTVTAVPGGGSLALSGGTIALGDCAVSVAVTSASVNSFANTIPIGAVTTTNADAEISWRASATSTVGLR